MKIKKLQLHNFGVYAGTNTFEFIGKKPIVLIGGLNGRGKTTFLEAILLSLYGANSFAYQESGYSTYGQYLKAYVNQSDGSLDTYVEMEFSMNEQDNEIYKIRRGWNGSGQRTHENITIWKNGITDDFLTKNWGMFIENMLPSALSSFFFFDGEKIAELAVDYSNEQLKESIRSMLGLAVLDRLSSDIQRTVRRNNKQLSNNEDIAKIEELQGRKDDLQKQLGEYDEQITLLESRIRGNIENNEKEQLDYSAHGGDVVEQRHEILEKRAVIREKIHQGELKLVDLAAQSLPLLMVDDMMGEVIEGAEEEQEYEAIKSVACKIEELYSKYAYEQKTQIDQGFLKYIRKETKKNRQKSVYGMSQQSLFLIKDIVDNKIPSERKQVDIILKELSELQRQADEIDSYLTVDINEKELNRIYKRIKEREQLIVSDQTKLSQIKKDRAGINGEFIKISSELSRMTENVLNSLESKDDNERYMKYSQMALKVIDCYSEKLQARKTEILASQITDCYKKLANKRNHIYHITMDSKTLELLYLDVDGNEVPKSSLSAGEKQLMVISILWALAICSKKKLPVIIDTPLSRLDSNHRKAIIKKYFPNASEQTIILSTDSEIDRNYYEMMCKNVGDEFTLVYDDESKSTTIKEGYLIG